MSAVALGGAVGAVRRQRRTRSGGSGRVTDAPPLRRAVSLDSGLDFAAEEEGASAAALRGVGAEGGAGVGSSGSGTSAAAVAAAAAPMTPVRDLAKRFAAAAAAVAASGEGGGRACATAAAPRGPRPFSAGNTPRARDAEGSRGGSGVGPAVGRGGFKAAWHEGAGASSGNVMVKC
jgi:hypothetical protein